jgi:hypothetical protein
MNANSSSLGSGEASMATLMPGSMAGSMLMILFQPGV